MKWFVAALLSLCASTLSADPIVLTFEEFSIDAGHQFIDISNTPDGVYDINVKVV